MSWLCVGCIFQTKIHGFIRISCLDPETNLVWRMIWSNYANWGKQSFNFRTDSCWQENQKNPRKLRDYRDQEKDKCRIFEHQVEQFQQNKSDKFWKKIISCEGHFEKMLKSLEKLMKWHVLLCLKCKYFATTIIAMQISIAKFKLTVIQMSIQCWYQNMYRVSQKTLQRFKLNFKSLECFWDTLYICHFKFYRGTYCLPSKHWKISYFWFDAINLNVHPVVLFYLLRNNFVVCVGW